MDIHLSENTWIFTKWPLTKRHKEVSELLLWLLFFGDSLFIRTTWGLIRSTSIPWRVMPSLTPHKSARLHMTTALSCLPTSVHWGWNSQHRSHSVHANDIWTTTQELSNRDKRVTRTQNSCPLSSCLRFISRQERGTPCVPDCRVAIIKRRPKLSSFITFWKLFADHYCLHLGWTLLIISLW